MSADHDSRPRSVGRLHRWLPVDADRARFVRFLFQPVLVAWALWSTGAWRELLRARRSSDRSVGDDELAD